MVSVYFSGISKLVKKNVEWLGLKKMIKGGIGVGIILYVSVVNG